MELKLVTIPKTVERFIKHLMLFTQGKALSRECHQPKLTLVGDKSVDEFW